MWTKILPLFWSYNTNNKKWMHLHINIWKNQFLTYILPFKLWDWQFNGPFLGFTKILYFNFSITLKLILLFYLSAIRMHLVIESEQILTMHHYFIHWPSSSMMGKYPIAKKSPIDQIGNNIWRKLIAFLTIRSIYSNGTNYNNLLLNYGENLWKNLMGKI